MANHGGGYAYRLAPAGGPLTERRSAARRSTLRATRPAGTATRPLSSSLTRRPRLGGARGHRAIRIGVAQTRSRRGSGARGAQFAPVCDESDECRAMMSQGNWASGWLGSTCKCSGFQRRPAAPEPRVVDCVRIPGARARPVGAAVAVDCEESDQVWMSCADVESRNLVCGSGHGEHRRPGRRPPGSCVNSDCFSQRERGYRAGCAPAPLHRVPAAPPGTESAVEAPAGAQFARVRTRLTRPSRCWR